MMCSGTTVHSFSGGGGVGGILECIIVHIKIIIPCAMSASVSQLEQTNL